MGQVSKVLGMSKWVATLRKHKAKAAKGLERGLKKAGLLLQRESMKVCPVDTGNLRAGAFTRAQGSGFTTQVLVGYVADYAIYVHEDLEAAHGAAYNAKYAAEIAAAEGVKGGKTKKVQQKHGDTWREVRIRTGFHARGENQIAQFLAVPMKVNRSKMIDIVATEVEKSL